MNPQHLMVLAASLNALGITKSNLEDMMPFRIIALPKSDTNILPSRDITQPVTHVKPSVAKQIPVQRRQPDGKNGCHNF